MADLGRRERKHAQTRLALLAALTERLAERPLEEISVRELAAAADISEATFFNHFPAKLDLAIYFVQIWSLDAAWRARAAERTSTRAAIAAVFDATADVVARHPRVMAEIIVVQARLPGRMTPPPLTRAERQLAYPDRPGIEAIEAAGLDDILPPLLDRAVERGELPATVDRQQAFLALTAIFFGVPLVLGPRAPHLVADAYRRQLDIVWAGLSTPPRSPS